MNCALGTAKWNEIPGRYTRSALGRIPHELLSEHARQVLASDGAEVMVSAASAWEISTKYRLGKLPHASVLAEDFVNQVTSAGYMLLSISAEHATRAGRLPGEHRDPFDRMLAAQAIHEDILC